MNSSLAPSVVPSSFVVDFCADVKAVSANAKEDARLLGVDNAVLHVFLEDLDEKVRALEENLRAVKDDPTPMLSAELAVAKHVTSDATDENAFLRHALNAEEVRIQEMLWRLGSRDKILADLKAHVIRQSTHAQSGMPGASYAAIPFDMVEALDAEVQHVQDRAARKITAAYTSNDISLQKQKVTYEARLEAKEKELIQAHMRFRDSVRTLEVAHGNELQKRNDELMSLNKALTEVDQIATQRAEAYFTARFEERLADVRRDFARTTEGLRHEVSVLDAEASALRDQLSDSEFQRESMEKQAIYLQRALRHVLEVEVPALKARGRGSGDENSTARGQSAAHQEEHMATVNRVLHLETEMSNLNRLMQEERAKWDKEQATLQQQLSSARNEAQLKDIAMREAQALRTQLNSQLQNALKTEMQLQTEVDFLRRSSGNASAETFKKMLEQAEADHDVRMVELTEEATSLRERLNILLDEKVELLERLHVADVTFKACDAERTDFRTRSNKSELRMSEMKIQFDSVQQRLMEVQASLSKEREETTALQAKLTATQKQLVDTQQQAMATSAASFSTGGAVPSSAGTSRGGSMTRTKSMRQSVVGFGGSRSTLSPMAGAVGDTSLSLKRIGSTVRRVGSVANLTRTQSTVYSQSAANTSTTTVPKSEKLAERSVTDMPVDTFVVGSKQRKKLSSSGGGSPDTDTLVAHSEESKLIDPLDASLNTGRSTFVPFPVVQVEDMGDSTIGTAAPSARLMSASQNLAVNTFVFPVSPRFDGDATPNPGDMSHLFAVPGAFGMSSMHRPSLTSATELASISNFASNVGTLVDVHRVTSGVGLGDDEVQMFAAFSTTDVPVALPRTMTGGSIHNTSTDATAPMMAQSYSSFRKPLISVPSFGGPSLHTVHSLVASQQQQRIAPPQMCDASTQCTPATQETPQPPRVVHGATIPVSLDERRMHAQLRHELTVVHREVGYLEQQLRSLHNQHPVLQRSLSADGNGTDAMMPLWTRARRMCEVRRLELDPIPFTDITHRKEFTDLNQAMATELEGRHKILVQMRRILGEDLHALTALGADATTGLSDASGQDPTTEGSPQHHNNRSPHRGKPSSAVPLSLPVTVAPLRQSMPPAKDILVASPRGNPATQQPVAAPPGANARTSPARVRLALLASSSLVPPPDVPVSPRPCGGTYTTSQPTLVPKRPWSGGRPSSAATSRRTCSSSAGMSDPATPNSFTLLQDLRTSVSHVTEPAEYFSVGYNVHRPVHSAKASRAPVWTSALMAPHPAEVASPNAPTMRVVSSSGR